jgi:SAM-dependent methyltransferase
VTKSPGTDWEELARHTPYFRVLTNEGVLEVEGGGVATPEFLETGEADVASLLRAAASIIGHDVALTRSLDFGCGVGRLTLPLARRSTHVVACDISPTMLAHVRQNAGDAGLHNITLIETDQLDRLPDGRFDFICSLLVLQYIPRSSGYKLVHTLSRLLAPGGVAILHVLLAPPGQALRQLARMSRSGSRSTVSPPQADRTVSRADALQTYEYDERVINRETKAAGALVIRRLDIHAGDTSGAVLVIQKAVSSPAPPAQAKGRPRRRRPAAG